MGYGLLMTGKIHEIVPHYFHILHNHNMVLSYFGLNFEKVKSDEIQHVAKAELRFQYFLRSSIIHGQKFFPRQNSHPSPQCGSLIDYAVYATNTGKTVEQNHTASPSRQCVDLTEQMIHFHKV